MGIFPFIIDYCLEMIIITLNLVGLYILTYTITTTKKKFQYTLCKVSQILSLTFFLNQTLGKIFASTSKKLTLSLYYLIYSFWWRVKIFYVISLCIYKKYSNMYFYVNIYVCYYMTYFLQAPLWKLVLAFASASLSIHRCL